MTFCPMNEPFLNEILGQFDPAVLSTTEAEHVLNFTGLIQMAFKTTHHDLTSHVLAAEQYLWLEMFHEIRAIYGEEYSVFSDCILLQRFLDFSEKYCLL